MASNPMQQFSVHKIGPEIKIAGIDLSFTNASLFMVISASIILLFLFFGTKEKKIIPDKIQLIAEMFYTFVAKMISDTAGSKAKPYFPFIFSLFMFVLFCNMVGMLALLIYSNKSYYCYFNNGFIYFYCSNNYWIC